MRLPDSFNSDILIVESLVSSVYNKISKHFFTCDLSLWEEE